MCRWWPALGGTKSLLAIMQNYAPWLSPSHGHLHCFVPVADFWHQKNTDYNNSPFHISQCFVLRLSDLQSVNVGLFDQHFRLTGE